MIRVESLTAKKMLDMRQIFFSYKPGLFCFIHCVLEFEEDNSI